MRRRQRRQHYRLNAPGSSSKADIVESLLKLGDVARNEHVGEVQIALGKAKLFIDKFQLIQFDGRYQQLVEKLAAHLRGEKVTRDEEPSARASSSSSSSSSSRSSSSSQEDFWSRSRRHAQEDATRRWKEYVKAQEAKKAGGHAGADAGYDPFGWRRSRRRQSANDRARRRYGADGSTTSYHRPSRYDGIEWLWKLASCPKRGKAGERWKAYYGAKTVQEMLDKGGKWSDIKYNIQHGYMKTFVQ